MNKVPASDLPSNLVPQSDLPSSLVPSSDLPKSKKTEKPGFVERFGETFQPVKAITEEGIIPQLGQYAKRKLTGSQRQRQRKSQNDQCQ